jgi:serine/threonine protein kinase/formylglycine-generating enzyme required for sulfatase activity
MWEGGGSPPDVFAFLAGCLETTPAEKAEICVIDQLHRWPMGLGFPVERYLEHVAEIGSDHQLKLRLVMVEFRARQASGGSPELGSFLRRFPELGDPLRAALVSPPANGSPPAGAALTKTLPSTEIASLGSPTHGDSGDQDFLAPFVVDPAAPPSFPMKIGRYGVLRILGDGGFGRVYLAYDDVLRRQVAIKVPHAYRISGPADVEAYLQEARLVAGLDDREIAVVPVYDCGETEDGLCYVVSKYIEGSDLATKIKRTPLTFSAAAELVARVAEALHAAHLHGVIHRDVKPANILIDVNDRPFLADFGIALQEEDYGTGDRTMGTIPYMSPEQLRGEGHLVDGRSDIFSLGVVLYELMTGRRPFPSNRFAQAALAEVRPPRQINDGIPKELERICLKALAHRVGDRYSTAVDLAVDLGDFLKVGSGSGRPAAVVATPSGSGILPTSGHLLAAREIAIVPKGLRSFDRDDAGFFLELLPGPRDRDGLPESVHFWKTRIQETDPDQTFRVGLLYGPSGCGKSSLLKAGVMPRLGDDVISIYIESTPLDTEIRLLKALRKECPDLPHDLGLAETATALRRGRGGRKKVLVVLDQFEQWLHARPSMEQSDLIRALRQSDGQHLQCVLSVRDDFWMAVTDLMVELDVALVPGENVAAIDLFSLRHAKKVLTAIGHAYNALPPVGNDLSAEQKQFINQAIAGLARDDRVIPVHLALFAEMIKDRPWVRATLKELGGTEGVGVTFLEETFNGPTANPSHRLHQKAARLVLAALLSDKGGSIKGAMRSHQELLEVSGYQQQPREFGSLLRILDSELRLITPTDPEGLEMDAAARSGSASGQPERYYHLTHDYLVPSLREWLTRKQKETRRGRAELLLAERAAAWNADSHSRSLPSFLEWLIILLFTTRRFRAQGRENQNVSQAAARYYVSRILMAGVLVALFVWGARWQSDRSRARGLVDSLVRARTQDVPAIVAELTPLRKWADPLLRERLAAADPATPAQLHAAMALLPTDRGQEQTVFEGMLAASPKEMAAIRDALASGGDPDKLSARLWDELLQPKNLPGRRFRAAVALAWLDPPRPGPPSGHWPQASDFLSQQLIAELAADTTSVDSWIELLRPIRTVLYADLRAICVDAKRPGIDRHMAATVLGEFVADQPGQLTDLMLEVEPEQYALLLPKLQRLGDPAREALMAAFNASIPAAGTVAQRRRPVKRRAHAAVALLEFARTEPLVAVLSATSDPDLCTSAEDRVSRLAARPDILLQLVQAADTTLRAALVRCLAGMPHDRLPEELKEPLATTMERLFQTDPDPGVHSAAEWALRSWGLNDRLARFAKQLVSAGPVSDRGWYVNHAGHTLVIFRGPISVRTGSPPDEPGRDASDEGLATRRINRDFALSTTEVTLEQFLRYLPDFRHTKKKEYTPSPDCPIILVTWHRAAEYCNWLSKLEAIPADQWCYKLVPPNATPYLDYLQRTGYRLPTEVEWEYACRAGTTTAFSWGDDRQNFRRFDWTVENSGGHNWPVGSLSPNRFGLFDMHGNAAEWVQDKFEFDKNDKPVIKTGEDIEQKDWWLTEDSPRGLRGGAASSYVEYHRSANRTYTKARSGVSQFTGFRVARTLKLARP